MSSRSSKTGLSEIHHLSPFSIAAQRTLARKRNGSYRTEKRTGRSRPIADIAVPGAVGQVRRMSDDEYHLLRALALMCAQYIGDGKWVDHECMAAGEEAVAQLVKHGMLEPSERGGRWTEAGERLRK